MTAAVLLLKPKQAAEALAISPRTLWALTASGEIPSVPKRNISIVNGVFVKNEGKRNEHTDTYDKYKT